MSTATSAEPGQTADSAARRAPVIYHIVLELAREPGHPFGDRDHAYHLYLPLKPGGEIDAEGWRRTRAACRVRRLRPNQPEITGRILHGPGGHWIFDYPPGSSADDENGFRLEREHFVPGEYVSVREDDGSMHTFRVISVKPL